MAQVSFKQDIEPTFAKYQAQMMWRFDLTNYSAVKQNAQLIWSRINGGNMPPAPYESLSAQFLATYKLWMDGNCQP
jgi:hypothetical protein